MAVLAISWILLIYTVIRLLCQDFQTDYIGKMSKRSGNLWDTLTGQGVNPNSKPPEYEKQLCNTTGIDCYITIPTCDDFDGQPEKCGNETIVKDCIYSPTCKKCRSNKHIVEICLPCSDFDGQKENCEDAALYNKCIYSCGKCQDNNEAAQICPTCDHWHGKQDECRDQPFCYWECDVDKCNPNEDLTEGTKCNEHCVSYCDCQKETGCYHTSIKNAFIEKEIDGETATSVESMSCKPVQQECNFQTSGFAATDCIRSNTGKNYYFLNGQLCSPQNFEKGHCGIEKEIQSGKFPGLGLAESPVFAQIIEQGRYELMLQIDKIDFTSGSPQIYTVYINGMKFNMKFLEEEFVGKDTTDITVVLYFVAEKRLFHPVDEFPMKAWTLDIKGSDFNWILGNLSVTTKESQCKGVNDINTLTSFTLQKLTNDGCEIYNGSACNCTAANSLCLYNETSGMCTDFFPSGRLPECTRQIHHNCGLGIYWEAKNAVFENGGLCEPAYPLPNTFCDVEEVMEAIHFNGEEFYMLIRYHVKEGKVVFRSVSENFYETNSDVPIKAAGPGNCKRPFCTYVTNEESKSGCLHLNVSIPIDGSSELFIIGSNVFGIPQIFDVKLDDKLLIHGIDIWKLANYETCHPVKIYRFFNVTQQATHLSFIDSQFETEIKEKQIKVSFCNSECEKVKFKHFMISAFALFRFKTSMGRQTVVA